MGAIDRTQDFREYAAVLRNQPGEEQAATADVAATIMQPIASPTAFTETAVALRSSLANMITFIREQESAYLDMGLQFAAGAAMSSQERETLDSEVSGFVMQCGVSINSLQETIAGGGSSKLNAAAHQRTVVISLYDQLRGVTEALDRMRKTRARRQKEQTERLRPEKYRPNLSAADLAALAPDPNPEEAAFEVLDEAEAQLFEQENADLFDELEDKMEDIEHKSAEVSALMSLFATKVMEQEEQIQGVNDNAIKVRLPLLAFCTWLPIFRARKQLTRPTTSCGRRRREAWTPA
jgi:hypothetical protein